MPTPINVKSKIFSDEDNFGNLVHLKVFYDEQGKHNNAIIYLQLGKHKRIRKIGMLDFKNKTFYCNRQKSKHYHRKTQGYGFNYLILNHPYIPIRKVHMTIDSHDEYEFDKTLILEHGIALNFSQRGFEFQKFLPFDIIQSFRCL